jgi:hypothetical protein
MSAPFYIPDASASFGGEPAPDGFRRSLISLRVDLGMAGVDRCEIVLANDGWLWQDHPALAIDAPITVHMGYLPGGLPTVFDGIIVARALDLPAGGPGVVTIAAHDRRQKLRTGNRVRWFAIPVPSYGNLPLPDLATASLVALENLLIPMFDPVGAALAILLGGVDVAMAIADPDAGQKVIRKQADESDEKFLTRIASDNGWDMVMEHAGPIGGRLLRFQSSGDRLEPDAVLDWGKSLLSFSSRESSVGVFEAVSGSVWVPSIKTNFQITLGWDFDANFLSLMIVPGSFPFIGTKPSGFAIEDPLTLWSAPRRLVSELIPRLNERTTGTGACLGDPAIAAGGVVQIQGVGERAGGRYRVTGASHVFDASGYRTSFTLRKDIWFGLIPAEAQGAAPIHAQGRLRP